jgi:2,3-bisphosphoglycerate-dependent phosphoglycerate mutase
LQTEVVLVRHAISVPRTADGPDELTRPLAPDGLRQALALADPLSVPRPAAVWSSPYLRAVQTVAPAAHALGLEVQTRWELREWDDGLAFTNDWIPHYERSWADPSFVLPAGESMDQVADRAVAALRTLADQYAGKRVLVGSHGAFVSRALRGFGAAVDRHFWQHMPMPAVYCLRFADTSQQPEMTGPGLGGVPLR